MHALTKGGRREGSLAHLHNLRMRGPALRPAQGGFVVGSGRFQHATRRCSLVRAALAIACAAFFLMMLTFALSGRGDDKPSDGKLAERLAMEQAQHHADAEHAKARQQAAEGGSGVTGKATQADQQRRDRGRFAWKPNQSARGPGRSTDDALDLVLPRHAALEGSADESQVVYYPGQDAQFPRHKFRSSWSVPPGAPGTQLPLHAQIDQKKMATQEHIDSAKFLPERFRSRWRPHYAGAADPLVAARWAADDAVPGDDDPLWLAAPAAAGGVAQDAKPRKVTVLMWDGMTPFSWGQGNPVGAPNYAGYRIEKPKCPVECEWTADKRRWADADALVFDVCLTGPTEFRQIPVHMPERLPGQQWWWFAYEQQYYFPMMRESDYMRRFDSKLLYHYDSRTQTTFTCPWAGKNTFLDPPPPKSSDKVVAAFLSNCNTGGALQRTEYVKELSKYVKVDSYGGCLKNSKIRQDQDKGMRRSHGDKINEKITVISEYKFLLAFENNNGVDDYVTEKMTNAYQAGTVPVYWGSPTVDRWTIANYSIIRTTDFASPKELGEYLSFLNDNEDAYRRYFEWKKNGIGEQYRRLLDKCLFEKECDMCKQVAMAIGEPAEHARLQQTRSKHDLGYALRLNCLDCRVDRGPQFVDIQHSASLNLKDKFTLAAWIQLSVIQDGRIIDKNTAGRIDGYMFDVIKQDGPSGVLRLCAGGACVSGERRLYTGIWYHVAVTYDTEDKTRFYVNGHLDTARNPGSAVATNSLPVRIGKAATGGWSWRPHHQTSTFDGIVDDVAIFSSPLDEQDIFELMFARLSGDEPSLVAFLGFNEGKGNAAQDVSRNNNHGRIQGVPTWVQNVGKPLIDPTSMERTV
jgi:Glycosyltransferase family 10 (fucosyltransferase) C-term/Concanavalin A-like lectin/glucanases superfamily